MSDLDIAIRAALDDFCTTSWCAEMGRAAIEGVLDLHQPESVAYIDRDGQERASDDCEVCGGNGSADSWPCLTIVAIARGLGLLDEEEP